MSKKKNNASKEVIRKKERTHILINFTTKELAERNRQFSDLCVEKSKKEAAFEKLKGEIKEYKQRVSELAWDLEAGGITSLETCDVEIDPSTMKKKYFFGGQLVLEEDAGESDLQTEIQDEEYEDNAN